MSLQLPRRVLGLQPPPRVFKNVQTKSRSAKLNKLELTLFILRMGRSKPQLMLSQKPSLHMLLYHRFTLPKQGLWVSTSGSWRSREPKRPSSVTRTLNWYALYYRNRRPLMWSFKLTIALFPRFYRYIYKKAPRGMTLVQTQTVQLLTSLHLRTRPPGILFP